jgi:hypothetical protein
MISDYITLGVAQTLLAGAHLLGDNRTGKNAGVT